MVSKHLNLIKRIMLFVYILATGAVFQSTVCADILTNFSASFCQEIDKVVMLIELVLQLSLRRKGKRSVTDQSVHNMVKKWSGEINLRGNYGGNSLRKTLGSVQRTDYGVKSKNSLPTIHSFESGYNDAALGH